jgi:hypothetical protein
MGEWNSRAAEQRSRRRWLEARGERREQSSEAEGERAEKKGRRVGREGGRFIGLDWIYRNKLEFRTGCICRNKLDWQRAGFDLSEQVRLAMGWSDLDCFFFDNGLDFFLDNGLDLQEPATPLPIAPRLPQSEVRARKP